MNPSIGHGEPYYEVAQGHGPFLLLVHGILSSRAQWIPNLEALSKVARPVTVELLGHGRSPAPDSPEAYHPDAYIKAFDAIRQRIGAPDWFICGQSLGAALTLRYALAHPASIKGQIFTNTIAAFAQTENLSGVRSLAEISAAEIRKHGPKYLERLSMHPANARHLREDVKAALIQDCARADLQGIVNTLQYTMPQISIRDKIHTNRVPSLLVCGSREKRFQVFRDFAREHMPCLEIVDLNAGHAVNVGASEQFNKAVVQFITRLQQGDSGCASTYLHTVESP